ncbi:MAG: hypothetical protein WCJ09_03470 [Planctomycetota bacterium]
MCWSRMAWLGLAMSICIVTQAAETYRLEEPVDDTRVFGVGTRIDITGKTQPSPKIDPLPLVASAALSYRERRLLGPGTETELFRSVREYEQTHADIEVGGQKSTSQLAAPLKLLVAQGRADGVELYSLGGPLTSGELDLIRSPADSLALMALLPTKPVSVGDKWSAPNWAFQMLTALDAVVKGELTFTLTSVEKQVARIKLEGTLEGAALSAVSQITVNGFYEYDLTQKCISQCDFTQVEKRGFGPVSPAFEFTARVRLLRRPAPTPGKLADQKLIDSAINEPKPVARYLRFESPWNIGFEYPRYWHLWKIQEKAAIFRLIDDGNFVAQCDLAPIAPAKPGEHLSETDFQRDIRQAMGERLRTIGTGEVIPTTDRRYVLKIVATGVDGERPLTWNFYLIADPSGRQATLSVTVDTGLVEALANRDREFLTSLRFGPAPTVPR